MKGRHDLRHRLAAAAVSIAIAAGSAIFSVPHAMAATEGKPYDEKLLRLAEILGAVHYLRELCSANEGLYWRERMKELLDAEGWDCC